MEANQEANQEAQSAKADVRKTQLGHLRDAKDELVVARHVYREALDWCRDAGLSVSDIASALGISRTAVYKQLNRKEG